MSDVQYVLSVDTGKHFAAALLAYSEGKDPWLVDMYYQHEEAFMSEDVRLIAESLGQVLILHDVPPGRLDMVVELPSHRYFGRGNSSALLKAFWQGLRLMFRYAGKTRKVIPIPADRWNKQKGDKEKKEIFLDAFEDFKTVPYYQDKHGSRSNDHERDAALIGLWTIDRIRSNKSFSFS